MAQEKDLKEPLKNLVKETVGNIVSQLVKASARKTVAELRKKLKEATLHRVEAKLKEAAEAELEKRLSQSGRGLQKAITQDNPSGPDYVSKLKQGFEKDFGKLLSSLKGISTLAVITISCVCTLVVTVVIGWIIVYCFIEPPPPEPQPDLVVTGITLQIETVYYEGPTPELGPETDIYAILEEFGGCPPGYQLVISYTIENQGDKAAGPSTTCLYFCGEDFAQDSVGVLAAGETAEGDSSYYPFLREVIYLYLCCACTDIEIEVCADCDQSVAESNEANNCFTLQLNQPR
jgi:hypothetical protein